MALSLYAEGGKVEWFDDEVASVQCPCGDKLLVSIEGTTCDCGRRLLLRQYVEIEIGPTEGGG